MPWNQGGGPWGGGGGGGQSPWGRPPGGMGPQPPNIEELLKRGQERVRRILPGGLGSGKGALFVVLAAIVGWIFSGLLSRPAR